MLFRTSLAVSVILASLAVGRALAQRDDAFGASRDHPAIAYGTAPVADAVSALNERLKAGASTLRFEPATGYLRATLEALRIPIESQVVVFSQTSAQAPLIDRTNPRAIYFNDNLAVGWVRGGAVLEVAAQDPRQGTIFYTLHQSAGSVPQLARDDSCLRCHLSWDTRAVPGPMILTTHPRRSESDYANGGIVDHREPIRNRWGGWFVTGRRVPARHMGNTPMVDPRAADPEQTPPAPKLASLEGQFDLEGFLTPHSDVVALLVLEHQAHLANLITRAGWEARLAAYEAGSRDGNGMAAAALPVRVREAIDEMIDYMLFVDEVPLTGPVAGASGFAERFTALGPRDERGRSLRDLDLSERMMKYPLSYMIYSTAFDGLPAEVKAAAYDRLWQVLSGGERAPRYAHLTLAKRQAVVEILRATKADLPPVFRPPTR
jgi:hypothetical protein